MFDITLKRLTKLFQSTFYVVGAKHTVGAGCWITLEKCPANGRIQHRFYDAEGSTNYHTGHYMFLKSFKNDIKYTEKYTYLIASMNLLKLESSPWFIVAIAWCLLEVAYIHCAL